jgi:chromosome segregation ATPase
MKSRVTIEVSNTLKELMGLEEKAAYYQDKFEESESDVEYLSEQLEECRQELAFSITETAQSKFEVEWLKCLLDEYKASVIRLERENERKVSPCVSTSAPYMYFRD